jgi:PHD/YefM family antitoxin component YafN of YafNO toxin-antitoxin module
MLTIEREEILSTTDVIKNFANCRDITKKLTKTVIFKNNKPDLVMLDIDEYERMHKLVDLVENLDIIAMLKERAQSDNGTRYSLDEIGKMFNL